MVVPIALEGTLDLSSTDMGVAISADGTRLVYVTGQADGQRRLWVRDMGQLDAVALLAADTNPQDPFLSPDGQWVGYRDGRALMKVAVAGGTPVTICELPRRDARSELGV